MAAGRNTPGRNLAAAILAAGALACLAVPAGCQRKVLLDEETAVTLRLTGPAGDGEAMFRGLVYDAASGAQTGYGFVGATGGTLSVPAGPRTIFVHSFGCESTLVGGEGSLHGLHLYTNPADAASQDAWRQAAALPAENGSALDPAVEDVVVWEPDPMEAALLEDLDVPRRAEGETLVYDAVLAPCVRSYTVRLTGAQGLRYVASAAAFAAGVAERRPVGRDADAGAAVVTRAALSRDGDVLVAAVTCLGFHPAARQSLHVVLTDLAGETFRYDYDITEMSAGDGAVTLESGIAVAEAEAPSGGGFAPTIEDWKTKVVPVRL